MNPPSSPRLETSPFWIWFSSAFLLFIKNNNKEGGRARYVFYLLKITINKEGGRVRYSWDYACQILKKLDGCRHSAIRKALPNKHDDLSSIHKSSHKKLGVVISLVIPALRRQKQMSFRGLLSGQPSLKTSFRPTRSPIFSKPNVWCWGRRPEVTIGLLHACICNAHGWCGVLKSLKFEPLSSEFYNMMKLQTDDLLLSSWILGQSETVRFSSSRKASTKQLFHLSIFNHSTPSSVAFSNNPVDYPSVSVQHPSLSLTICSSGIPGYIQFPKTF